MNAPRNWRDAKIPQWVKDSFADEARDLRIRAALAWPKEPRPTPMPFQWVDYDRPKGDPQEGTFWGRDGKVHIRKEGPFKWKFSCDGERWTDSRTRGHLFATERDAILERLWVACESYANALAHIRNEL